jgi:hypothetical protein
MSLKPTAQRCRNHLNKSCAHYLQKTQNSAVDKQRSLNIQVTKYTLIRASACYPLPPRAQMWPRIHQCRIHSLIQMVHVGNKEKIRHGQFLLRLVFEA